MSADGGAVTSRDGGATTSRDGRAPTTRDGVPPTSCDGSSGAPRETDFPLPDYLARDYEILDDHLGTGGEADVALIRQLGTGERKVVKVYHRGITLPQSFVQKLATANPAHVLPVSRSTYTGWSAPRFVELMEYLPDGSLETLLAQSGGRLENRAHDILVEMTDALDYIHNALGLVHRDIKPANVLIRKRDRLDLVLADLGIAAEVAVLRRSRRETTGGIKGTLVYQSPETLNMSDAGPPRDWWALGMMMCEVLTGQHPFKDGRGNTLHDENAIRHAITMNAIDLSVVTDPRWNLLCRGLLTHRPEDRWGAKQIRGWLDGDSPSVAAHRPEILAENRAIPPYRFAGQRFTNPTDLADHMVTHWDDAISLFTSGDECATLRAWIREDVGDKTIDTNLLMPVGGNTSRVDARILEFAAHYRGADIRYRNTRITARDLAARYLQAGQLWEGDPLLERINAEVIAALVETQFDETGGPTGQSADYYALRQLSRGEQEIDKAAQSASSDIISASSGRVADADVGVDVREAMPSRIATARGVARAALLSPACAAEIDRDFDRLDQRSPAWFAQLCKKARGSGGGDGGQMVLRALAVGVADLARNYELASVNAEEAAERRRREAAAAAERQRRESAAAAAEAARRSEQSERVTLTLFAFGSAALCLLVFFGRRLLDENVHTRDGFPSTWAYACLNWPSADLQIHALIGAIAASGIVAVLVGAVPPLKPIRSTLVVCVIVFSGLCLLPIVLALLCFVLFIVIVVGIIGVIGAILIGMASG